MLQRIGADSGVDSNGDFPQARALSRYLDQKQGMEMRLNALSQLWRLSRFVGMLTDSRSFLSYPRHEYFRRFLHVTSRRRRRVAAGVLAEAPRR